MGRILALMSVLFLCAATPTQAVLSMFGFIDGIAGDSADDKDHKNWVDLLSIEQPVAGGATLNTLGPITGDFTMIKTVDATSPGLLAALAIGTVLNPVKVDLVDAINGTFLVSWTMDNAVIKSINPGPGGDPALTEVVTFSYSKIAYKYAELDLTGAETGSADASWDDLDTSPNVSTQGTLDDFMFLNNVVIPEPGSLLLLTVPLLGIAARRHSR